MGSLACTLSVSDRILGDATVRPVVGLRAIARVGDSPLLTACIMSSLLENAKIASLLIPSVSVRDTFVTDSSS